MKMDPVIFREYDIRGVYNEQFDTDFAFELGKAYTTFVCESLNVDSPNITLGMDARSSSPLLIDALAKGITSVGGNALKLGLVTTPMSYFSTFEVEGVVGSIMVTGSHNPPNYNGFKISVGKTTIHGSDIKKLETIINSKKYVSNGEGKISDLDIKEKYVHRYKDEFGTIKNIPVVVDCGNGAAGAITRDLYSAVGLDPIFLYEEPDGNFPNHHPDPTVEENLKDLSAKVLETGAVLGIGFDGDADRIGIIDEFGKMVYGDELLAFYARDILAENKGASIVGDVKCSDLVFKDIEAKGGKAVMWKSGHSLVKEKIKQESSPFGGEMSGHIFFNDRNYGYDDGPYAGLRVIEILAKTGKKFRELLELPKSFNTPEIRIDTTEEKKILIVDKIKEAFPPSDEYSVNTIDGVRLSFEDGWALVRSSNTQPVLVMRFEAWSEEGLKKISDQVESIVKPLL